MRRLATALEKLTPSAERWSNIDVERLVATIRGYLIPRFEEPSRPAVVVFAGPTGAGKSTLLNSVAGADVSTTGPLRPTTRTPIVLASAAHAESARVVGRVECEVVTSNAPILQSMSLVDTPDVDSTEVSHRLIAEAIVDHADIVVFVTSALRYADAVPWQLLRRAKARGTEVIIVLNRVSSSTSGALLDLGSRLEAAGLALDPMAIPEHHLGEGAQRIPAIAVRRLRRSLAELAAIREEAARDVVQRVAASTLEQVGSLIAEIEELGAQKEDIEVDFSVSVSRALASMVVEDVASGLYEELPDGASPRRSARWARRTHLRPSIADASGERLAHRIVRLLGAELRQRLGGPWRSDEPFPDVTPMLSREVDRWLEFVGRIAEGGGEATWAGKAALVASALAGNVTPEARLLFGDTADTLVERARREWGLRAQRVADDSAAMVADHLYRGVVDIDVEELRSAHGAVASTLAPVHA